jgi:Response regulator containing a CheY-like receiver domain and a GGDEF domain
MDRLKQALIHARRNASIIAIDYIDIDDFKQINNRFGHAVGISTD